MRSFERFGTLLLLVGALGLLPFAAAAEGQPVRVSLLVSHITNEPGPVDSRAKRLHAEIKDQFKYESLAVLDSRELVLTLDEPAAIELPNGRQIRLRPMDVGPEGVLFAVDVQGAVKSDMRVRDGHLVVIGAGSYDGGKLVISLEPHL